MGFDSWRLAVRNLFRHRTRSVSALVAIVFGVVALLIASGYIQWVFWAMRQAAIESQLGHIQVVRPGYFRDGLADPFRYRLPENDPALELVRSAPYVVMVTPRLNFSGLISHGDNTLSFLGVGVAAETERRVSKQVAMIEGEELTSGNSNQVILGEGLAAGLGVKVGDRVVLMANTASGGLNAIEMRVQGVFRSTTKAYDDMALRLPITAARRLLRTAGSHVWVVLLDDTAHTDMAVSALRRRLSDKDYDLVPWYEQADFYNKTVTLFSHQVGVVWLLIAVVIVLSISNTMIMSVLERTREIGTLLAVGFRRAKILRQFIVEGLVLGLVGGIMGLVVGVLLARVISLIGIPMPPPPGMAVGFVGRVIVTWTLAGGALLFALITSVVASAYPAWKASRLKIVDALRHNR